MDCPGNHDHHQLDTGDTIDSSADRQDVEIIIEDHEPEPATSNPSCCHSYSCYIFTMVFAIISTVATLGCSFYSIVYARKAIKRHKKDPVRAKEDCSMSWVWSVSCLVTWAAVSGVVYGFYTLFKAIGECVQALQACVDCLDGFGKLFS